MKNIFYIVIDSLRWDIFSNLDATAAVAPNLRKLLDSGFVRRVVTNSQSTQFVMPSIFSLTYPLDYGGYNAGIRDRPKSYVEILRAKGYRTNLISTCNQLGASFGYDRGFERLATTNNFATLIEQLIQRLLSYEAALGENGVRSEEETWKVVQREFGEALTGIQNQFLQWDKSFWTKQLYNWNERVYQGSIAELSLLKRNPKAILAKLRTITPGVYWKFLGQERAAPLSLLYARVIESFRWRTRNFLQHIHWFPLLLLSQYQTLMRDITPRMISFVSESETPWLIHSHIMDVHDCTAINRPLWRLLLLKYFPRILRARKLGYTNRRYLYDLTLAEVDNELGKIIDALKTSGKFKDTVFVVTGDHGSQYAQSPRVKKSVGMRTHYEDIEVPILLINADIAPPRETGLIDSMGVTATLLEAVGVPLDPSFKGISIFSGGREAVITESAGSGNADIDRKDLYFTVTTKDYKIMAILKDKILNVQQFYDLNKDPYELSNIVKKPNNQTIIIKLLSYLYQERRDIFIRRNVSLDPHDVLI